MKLLPTLGFFLAIAIALPITFNTISRKAEVQAVPRDDPKYGTRCGVPGMSCRKRGEGAA